jgi:opacity protein-like surface antigen
MGNFLGGTFSTSICCAALLALSPGVAGGQLPNPAAHAVGYGLNYTALARGFSAAAWNPAGLGMPDGRGTSFTVLSAAGASGLSPVAPGEIREYGGREVPEDVRRQWLDRIAASGGEQGVAGGDLTWWAAHAGRFGIHVATTALVASNLAPGAAELLLFGNAGRTGEPADLSLDGATFDLAIASTAAIALAQPILRTAERAAAVGATLKFTMGHVMVTAMDAGSEVGSDPLRVRVRFPIAQSDTLPSLDGLNQGTGVGLDLGGSWREGPLILGLALQNVVNTFRWDQSTMFYRPGLVNSAEGSAEVDFDPQPFHEAPEAIRRRVENIGYRTSVAAGAGYELTPELTLSGELRHRLGEGILDGATSHLGAGVEYRPVAWLPLRAGTAVISGGYLAGAGVGVRLSVIHLDAAVARQRSSLGGSSALMLTLSSASRF